MAYEGQNAILTVSIVMQVVDTVEEAVEYIFRREDML